MHDDAGTDRLFGGSGADVFVLRADGATDRIRDFQPGFDRIDLGLAFGDILIVDGANGTVEVRHAGDLLLLDRMTGPLSAALFTADAFI